MYCNICFEILRFFLLFALCSASAEPGPAHTSAAVGSSGDQDAIKGCDAELEQLAKAQAAERSRLEKLE